MKKSFKRYLSLVMVLMVAFVCLFSVSVKAASEVVATFELGANGSASHNDGSEIKSSVSYTVGDYKLTITSPTKTYSGARDAKGNSCLKLGTSSAVGSFSFTVPSDVTQVVIFAAKYKAKTSKVSVNGKSYTLQNSSDNGAYDEIKVDTSSQKTVSFTTVSGGVRCMVNTIVFYTEGASSTPSLSIDGEVYAKVDDVVTLTAKVENVEGTVAWSSSDEAVATVDQNGNVTAVAMGVATITATVGEVSDTLEFKVWPNNENVISIDLAKEICDFTGSADSAYKYSIEGEITKIDYAYSSSYNNISVTISDGANSLYIYKMIGGSDLSVGNRIIVTGYLCIYSGKYEVNENSTYEIVIEDSMSKVIETLNSVNSFVSLAYKYNVTEQSIKTADDTLNNKFTGVTGTSYTNWSNKEANSNAVYAGNTAGGSGDTAGTIQMRSNNSNSGIVTTTSGGKVTKIVVSWNAGTADERILDIYGSNEAFTSPTELYNEAANVKKIGSLSKGQTTLVVSEDYAYVGFRSNNGALYLDSIVITWEDDSYEGLTTINEYSNVDFRIRCAVDSKLAELADEVEEYGICVSTKDTTKLYVSAELEAVDGKLYVVISLGDVLNNKERLTTEFTIKSYVEVGGVKYYSESVKTFTLESLVEFYLNNAEELDIEASDLDKIKELNAVLEGLLK